MPDYETRHPAEREVDVDMQFEPNRRAFLTKQCHVELEAQYEGIKGTYAFIERCDRARRLSALV